jgi:enterochelin esterase family protein
MKKFPALPLLALCFTALAALGGAVTDRTYLLGPDSASHPAVPKGTVTGPTALRSSIFTNTTRDYWVYVPAQYDPSKPACLMVFQDGFAYVDTAGTNAEFFVPYVFDNLIYRREMPVTIGVFINAGHDPDNAKQKEPSYADWGDKLANRGIEYNTLNDKYARMIIEELMPVLNKQYNISPDPEMHGIVGASSGAICAFTVAWQRPDQFRKVISSIGSFTGLRGGNAYPDIIRTNPPKPIRVYLCDGVNDMPTRGIRDGAYDPSRDWHGQNIRMMQALTAQKYDLNFCWGIGTHSHMQAGAFMPEMLRWLWRDYPRIDDPKDNSNRTLYVPPGFPSPETNPPPATPAR